MGSALDVDELPTSRVDIRTSHDSPQTSGIRNTKLCESRDRERERCALPIFPVAVDHLEHHIPHALCNCYHYQSPCAVLSGYPLCRAVSVRRRAVSEASVLLLVRSRKPTPCRKDAASLCSLLSVVWQQRKQSGRHYYHYHILTFLIIPTPLMPTDSF